MLKYKKIIINTDNHKTEFNLEDGVILLSGNLGYGKSSIISLLYVLLGSKSTLNKKTKPNFNIFSNTEFEIKSFAEYTLEYIFDGKEYSNIMKIDSERNWRLLHKTPNNEKDVTNVGFRKLMGFFYSPTEVFNYSTKSKNKYDKYNINSYFRAMQKIGKPLFTPSTKTPHINRILTAILQGKREGTIEFENNLAKLKSEAIVLNRKLAKITHELKRYEKLKILEGNIPNDDSLDDSLIKLSESISKMQNKNFLYATLMKPVETNIKQIQQIKGIIESLDINQDLKNSITKDFVINSIEHVKNINTNRELQLKIDKNKADIDDKMEQLKINSQTKRNVYKAIYYKSELEMIDSEGLSTLSEKLKDEIKDNAQKEVILRDKHPIKEEPEIIKLINDNLEKFEIFSKVSEINSKFEVIFKEGDPELSTSQNLIKDIVILFSSLTLISRAGDEYTPEFITINEMIADLNTDEINKYGDQMMKLISEITRISKEKNIIFIIQDKNLYFKNLHHHNIKVLNPFHKKNI